MFCINCGREISENAEFCTHCGCKITKKPINSNNKISKLEVEKFTSKTKTEESMKKDIISDNQQNKINCTSQFNVRKGIFMERKEPIKNELPAKPALWWLIGGGIGFFMGIVVGRLEAVLVICIIALSLKDSTNGDFASNEYVYDRSWKKIYIKGFIKHNELVNEASKSQNKDVITVRNSQTAEQIELPVAFKGDTDIIGIARNKQENQDSNEEIIIPETKIIYTKDGAVAVTVDSPTVNMTKATTLSYLSSDSQHHNEKNITENNNE